MRSEHFSCHARLEASTLSVVFFLLLSQSTLTQLQTSRARDGRKRQRHNFITAVMSGAKVQRRYGDPGGIAYLQTCSSNASRQVISYTLIRRDDLISPPIREPRHYDSSGLPFILLTQPARSLFQDDLTFLIFFFFKSSCM